MELNGNQTVADLRVKRSKYPRSSAFIGGHHHEVGVLHRKLSG